jgi:hypothetical protein
MMNKVIRDGKVAVLYSPGFGAGWSTCNDSDYMFIPEIVKLVENQEHSKIPSEMNRLGYSGYYGGSDDLQIEWIPVGTKFMLDQYVVYESIEYYTENYWKEA